MENRVKCGKCQSEYSPRLLPGQVTSPTSASHPELKMDYSCPICGHGAVKESFRESKNILLD